MLEPIVEKNNQILTKLGIGFTNLEHPPIKEIHECLRYLNEPISVGISTLVMKADSRFVAIIRRDDCQINLSRACQIIGCQKLNIASPDEFEKLTHLPSGAAFVVNPDLPTYLDKKVFEQKYVIGGSGSLSVSNRYLPADLKKIPNSQVVDIADVKAKPRILTGDRPTGPLHLGHYVGTLANRVRLQDEYDCFFIMADLHTLTTAPTLDKTSTIIDRVRGLVLDYLSVGIDPDKSVIYQQSRIPEVAYLSLIFSNLVTVPRAQRVPTLKDVMHDLHLEQPSLGLLNYPVLQAADILMVKANLVPVGRDQESHLEVTREVARDFNHFYGEVFPEPKTLIGNVPTLIGTDGQAKMSKSIGNCIYLSDDATTVEKKVKSMYTDPARIRPTDPGHVENNPVFAYHDAFNEDKVEVADLKDRYQQGTVGDVEVKQKLALAINKFLDPIRARRAQFEDKTALLDDIIDQGSKKAQSEAAKTLSEVLSVMRIK